jgi:hypothetical protein
MPTLPLLVKEVSSENRLQYSCRGSFENPAFERHCHVLAYALFIVFSQQSNSAASNIVGISPAANFWLAWQLSVVLRSSVKPLHSAYGPARHLCQRQEPLLCCSCSCLLLFHIATGHTTGEGCFRPLQQRALTDL